MRDHVFHTRPFAWANGVLFAGLALAPEERQGEDLAATGIEQYRTNLFPARRLQDGAWQNSMSYGRKYLVRSAFHAMMAWSSATGEDLWHAAGQEARRRMAAAGYDVVPPEQSSKQLTGDLATCKSGPCLAQVAKTLGVK